MRKKPRFDRRIIGLTGSDQQVADAAKMFSVEYTKVRTGSDGLFVMPSVRALGPLGGTGWSSISLALELRGYETLTRSFNLSQSTNTSSGEPLVEAGEILLIRLAR